MPPEKIEGRHHDLQIPSLEAMLDLARSMRQSYSVAISAGGIGIALLGLAYKFRGEGYRLAFNTAVSFLKTLDEASYDIHDEFKFPLPDLPGTDRFSRSVMRNLSRPDTEPLLIDRRFYEPPIRGVIEIPSIQDGFYLQEIRFREQGQGPAKDKGRNRVQRRIVTGRYRLGDLDPVFPDHIERAGRSLADFY
ncbi:hypothetical protein HYW44_02565 [Candidatus Daviesbacteria bacterium]|nr:hypothetical protein [Candidatus Daviesbacteria bacterium]